MPVLAILPQSDGRALSLDEAAQLRFELERKVGAVSDCEGSDPEAKGSPADWATIAVAVLGSQAVTALVGVLKARIERDRSSEFVVKGPGGEVQIKSGDMSLLYPGEIRRLIELVLGKGPVGEGDAPSATDSSQPF